MRRLAGRPWGRRIVERPSLVGRHPARRRRARGRTIGVGVRVRAEMADGVVGGPPKREVTLPPQHPVVVTHLLAQGMSMAQRPCSHAMRSAGARARSRSATRCDGQRAVGDVRGCAESGNAAYLERRAAWTCRPPTLPMLMLCMLLCMRCCTLPFKSIHPWSARSGAANGTRRITNGGPRIWRDSTVKASGSQPLNASTTSRRHLPPCTPADLLVTPRRLARPIGGRPMFW